MNELAERVTRLRSWNAKEQADKLGLWRFAVPRLRQAFAMLAEPDGPTELHCRGPNLGTKSYTLAHYVTACVQQREALDGIPLPKWKGRVEAVQLVLDYKRQLLSVQPAYLKALEGWPHKARYFGEALSALRIKPYNGSDDESTWGVVHFLSQENRQAGVGIRADIVAFDEPPVIEILRELRKAGHANRKSIRIIAETPTVRRQWAPLRDDYGDTPRRSIRRIDRLRAEVRWSLDEVAEWVLDAERKRDLWDGYRGDLLFGEDGGARWHGDYTNTEGKCPFDAATLLQMLDACRDPDMVVLRPTVEQPDGSPETVVKVPVQVWKAVETGKRYYLDVDPASGVDDNAHNPAAIHLSEMGSGDLCVRWNGYLAPYTVGVLSAIIARQYNDATIDIEMKDHWGVNVVRGVQAQRYNNLASEQRELRPGVWSKEVGFDNNEEVRAIIIGSIQEWVSAWKAGVKYAACPSRAVIECLLDSELDERSKIVAGPGIAHGEDMVLWGQKLRRAVTRSNRAIPDHVIRKEQTPNEKLAAMIRGEDTEKWQHADRLPKPRKPARMR